VTPSDEPASRSSRGQTEVGAPAAPVSVVGMLCRTSDRTVLGGQGAEALARALAKRAGVKPFLYGAPGQAREGHWEDDLLEAVECLEVAREKLEEALTANSHPVVLASDCTIALGTLAGLAHTRPDAWVLWIDAHGDFNSPDTTLSGFLGGMCLAGACGVWETGLGTGPDPAQILICGARDLDPDERHLIEVNSVRLVEPDRVADMVRDRPLFVHVDLDVLDPSVIPGLAFPAPGGVDEDWLAELLSVVAESADVIGCQITSLTAPELAGRVAGAVAPIVRPRTAREGE
jgi:arginase